jgi:hypothetical protein
MPFPLIPSALGLCFLLVWAFIAGMIFRDEQIAARRDRELDAAILPRVPTRLSPSATRSLPVSNIRRSRSIRVAS